MQVVKTGCESFPWEARCLEHPGEQIFILGGLIGAVAFGTRGVGNRTWLLAMFAAQEHWRREHIYIPVGGP